ncbi:MAG: DUF1549 domain-containing protein, partial [Verrucomicrobia bacterium]|nr:DUF1549 domain-containing protein [Verrucomicrobiota bacterium]
MNRTLNAPQPAKLCPRLSRGGAALIALFVISTAACAAGAPEVSFRNDVMAVLSKTGCTAGTCHGNKSGKGGFKLSLRGEDADFDLRAITRDQFGRRVNLLEPEKSLLLQKTVTEVAHEGGKRFAKGSEEYEIVRRWIAAGAKDDRDGAPRLVKLEATPAEKFLVEPVREVRLKATATYSDGSKRDVTKLAVFEPSNTYVEVTPDGLVTGKRPGSETTVIVRYLNQQLPVALAFVPARKDFKWTEPKPHNFVDEHVFAKLQKLRENPSMLASDEVFLRRAFLDLCGILPTVKETHAFLADTSPNKRAKLVDALLARPEFADFWALKWSDVLKNEERQLDEKGVTVFHEWIRRSFADNKPLDVFVRELLVARGSTYSNAPANYYRANRDPVTRAETTAQVFLGTRLNCAQC